MFTIIDDGQGSKEKRQQRLFRKAAFAEVAKCTMWHWLLNKPAAELVGKKELNGGNTNLNSIEVGNRQQIDALVKTQGCLSRIPKAGGLRDSVTVIRLTGAQAAESLNQLWHRGDMLPAGASALEYLTSSPAFICTYVAELKDGGRANHGLDMGDDDDSTFPTQDAAGKAGVHWATISLWDGSQLNTVEIDGVSQWVRTTQGQTLVCGGAGILLLGYWHLICWFYRSAYYLLLLGVLLLTAASFYAVYRAARLVEFVAGGWAHQRFRARIFGAMKDGQHGSALLGHLLERAHDEARDMGFIGVVCAADLNDVIIPDRAKSKKKPTVRPVRPSHSRARARSKHLLLAPFRGLAVANKSLSKVVAKDLSLGLHRAGGSQGGPAMRWGSAADDPTRYSTYEEPKLLKLFFDPRDIN